MSTHLELSTNSNGVPLYFNINISTFSDFKLDLLPTILTLDLSLSMFGRVSRYYLLILIGHLLFIISDKVHVNNK